MKKTLTLIAFLSVSTFFAQTLTLGQAINMAAKQRMLSQRMAKDKVYKTMNQLKEEADAELQASIILFDQNLKLLLEFSPNKEIRYKLEIENLMWQEYKKNLLDKSRIATANVFDKNTYMLITCDNVVKEFLAYSETLPKAEGKSYDTSALSSTIASAGKLRYLTQRLTLYYASTYYKVNKSGVEEIKEAIEMFDKTLNAVTSSVVNNSDTEAKIAEIHRIWQNLKTSMYKDNQIMIDREKESVDAVVIYHKANEIMNNADQLTNLFSMMNLQKTTMKN